MSETTSGCTIPPTDVSGTGHTINIVKATKKYESWLSKHTRTIPQDLGRKHQEMAKGPFPFLRATFYRWLQVWEEVCPDLSRVPRVLGVGDLHVENFGTWRDSNGRLVWGINDFDEARPYPDAMAHAVERDWYDWKGAS